MADPKQTTLSPETIKYIERAVNVARLANIDNLIIETGKVRASDEDATVFICHDENIPAFPFGAIGLTRLGVFASRLDIATGIGSAKVEAVIDDSSETEPSFVRSLTFKAKGFKVDYRCANPKTIKAPKSIKDPIHHSCDMNASGVMMMTKGQSAMAADEAVLVGGKDGVKLEIRDVNSDALVFDICDTVTLEDGCSTPDFYHRYSIKVITNLFKQNPDGRFYITSKGILKISVDDFTVFVMPRSD